METLALLQIDAAVFDPPIPKPCQNLLKANKVDTFIANRKQTV